MTDAMTGMAVYVECPHCRCEGPHDGFSVNEAKCGDCDYEFSYAGMNWRTQLDVEEMKRGTPNPKWCGSNEPHQAHVHTVRVIGAVTVERDCLGPEAEKMMRPQVAIESDIAVYLAAEDDPQNMQEHYVEHYNARTRLANDAVVLLEVLCEDQLFPLTSDQRQRLHQLADDVYARHEQQHIPAIEECSFLECRMARVLGRGSN